MKKGLFITLLVGILMPFALKAQSTSHVDQTQTIAACGQYTWSVNGQTYIRDTTVSVNRNDTTFYLGLTINPIYSTPISTPTIHGGCTYEWGGDVKNASGYYTTTLQTVKHCDSVAAINLILSDTVYNTRSVTACESYIWHNNTLLADTSITNYYFHGTNCDSILTLNLTILAPRQITSDTFVTACYMGTPKFFVFSKGLPTLFVTTPGLNTLSTEIASIGLGPYARFFHPRGNTADQCFDSIRYAHITLNHPSTDSVHVESCGEYTYEGYFETYKNVYHIDTINDTLDVTYHVDSTTVPITIDTNYTINTTYDSTFLYIDTIQHDYSKTYTSSDPFDSILIGYNMFGCDSSALLNVTIHPLPVVSIAGDLTIQPGQTAILYAECDQENVSLLWNTGSTESQITTDPLNANTDFSIAATNNVTGCVGNSFVTITVNEGIENAQSDEVKLYPNPTSAKLNIECNNEIYNLSVFNTLGQRIMSNYNMPSTSTIDFSSLAQGNYTLRIQLRNGNTIVRHIIVSK